MTDDQIKHMVNRFLNWRLPESFSPDCGISFKRATPPPATPGGVKGNPQAPSRRLALWSNRQEDRPQSPGAP
jgi:hypothetical protein